MELHVTPVSRTYFAPTDTGICAEVSQLGGTPFKQLYDDACDIGIAVLSADGTKLARFCLEREHRNSDGDITHWTLKPTPETLKRFPQFTPLFTVTIFND